MTAAARLLPDPSPLRIEGGARYIGHPVELREFPVEYRAAARDVWDTLIERDLDDTTLLPDRLTDRVLHQLTGRSERSVQEGLYFLELGPAGCHALAGLERRLRAAVRAGDAGAAAGARAELVEFRLARQDLKDRFRQAGARMLAIDSGPEPTDADRERLAELAAERDRIRAELLAGGGLILRHSGPGFEGRRQIEITRPMAGARPKAPAAPPAKARGKAMAQGKSSSRGSSIPNLQSGTVPETTPEQAAAAAAQVAAATAGEIPGMTAEEQAEADRIWEESRKRREAAGRRKSRPALQLGPEVGASATVSPAMLELQRQIEASRREQAAREATPPPGSIQAALGPKAEALGFRAVPGPDDSS
jgi:hypothetical protein